MPEQKDQKISTKQKNWNAYNPTCFDHFKFEKEQEKIAAGKGFRMANENQENYERTERAKGYYVPRGNKLCYERDKRYSKSSWLERITWWFVIGLLGYVFFNIGRMFN